MIPPYPATCQVTAMYPFSHKILSLGLEIPNDRRTKTGVADNWTADKKKPQW